MMTILIMMTILLIIMMTIIPRHFGTPSALTILSDGRWQECQEPAVEPVTGFQQQLARTLLEEATTSITGPPSTAGPDALHCSYGAPGSHTDLQALVELHKFKDANNKCWRIV